MLDRQEVDKQNALQVAEAADRAGAIVSEQIRAIIDQATANAEQIRKEAELEADAIRQRAAESASRMLERIQALDGPLSQLVADLKHEAESLTAEFQGSRGT